LFFLVAIFEGDLTLLYQGMKDQVGEVVIRTAEKSSDRNFIKVNIEFVSIPKIVLTIASLIVLAQSFLTLTKE
jgi:hypothetical protein